MCGLFGFVDYKREIPQIDKTTMAKSMAIMSISRGRDAAGVCIVKSDRTRHIKKVDSDAKALNIKEMGQFDLLLGHTRAGTIGLKTVAQAHPFVYRGHVMAHNGTGHQDHNKLAWAQGPSGVDSETMLRYLLSKGGDTKEAISDFYEAWRMATFTITLLTPSDELVVFRDTNPFFFANIKDTSAYLYASEASIISAAASFLDYEITNPQAIAVREIIRFKKDGTISSELLDSKEDAKSYSSSGTWQTRRREDGASVHRPTAAPVKSAACSTGGTFVDGGNAGCQPVLFDNLGNMIPHQGGLQE